MLTGAAMPFFARGVSGRLSLPPGDGRGDGRNPGKLPVCCRVPAVSRWNSQRPAPVAPVVRGGRCPGSCTAGFTLIEVLVILVLIGIIISFAVLKVGGDRRADELDRSARTFAAVLELASDVPISRSEEWGVRVDAEGYRFVVLGQDKQDGKQDGKQDKARQDKWIDVENDPVFRARAWDRGMRVELELEGRDALLEDADKEEDKPNILLLSSGEMTPFVATFSARETKARAQVEGDGLGNVKTARLDEF